MKKVKNNAIDTIVWFPGAGDVPSAFLTKDKTIEMRVNVVIKTNIEGAIDRIVNKKRICKLFETSAGFVASSTPMVILGIICALRLIIKKTNRNKKNIFFNDILFPFSK
jgi:hypothetical protein